MKTNATHPSQTLTVTSADGTAITVDRSGQGAPVVCVDGAMSTRSLGPGKMLASHLADAFTVYTYDRRGRGDSGDASGYEVQREIEDLAAVIAAAGKDAMVFGHSSGCVLALEAAHAGAPITHLALYEPPFVIDRTRPAVGEAWAQELDGLLAAGRRGQAVRRFMVEVARAPRLVPLLMSLTPMFKQIKAVAHTLAYDTALLSPYQTGEPLPVNRFGDVRVPTRLLLGGKSPEWIANAAHALERVLPAGELTVLDGQTHMLKPKVTAPVVRQFFTHRTTATSDLDAEPAQDPIRHSRRSHDALAQGSRSR
jgi:pimeloyl-ACP methyl ester carboxylesterase